MVAVTLAGADHFWHAWLGWFAADGIGMIIIAPLIMLAVRADAWPRGYGRMMEAVIVLGLYAVTLVVIFAADGRTAPFVFRQPSSFVVPFVIWVGVRFRIAGTAVATLMLGVIVVWFTSQQTGPFIAPTRTVSEQVMAAQLFLVVAAVGALILAAIIDDLLRTQAALCHSEQRFRQFVDHTPTPCWIVDDECRIVFINTPYEHNLGRTFSQIRGRRLDEIFSPEIAAPFIAEAQRVLATGHAQQATHTAPTPSGEPRHGLTFVFPLTGTDGRRLVGGVAVDITDRVQAERKLKQLNETLEERVQERSAVAEARSNQLRALAHELTQTEQRERRRLAQILHDHLQQLLVAAKFKLGRAEDLPATDPTRKMKLEVAKLLDDAIRAGRALTVELSPPVLYDGGLTPALNWLASRVREEQGLIVDVQASVAVEPPEDLRAFLFESVRELLFNIVKHSGVRRAAVRMSGSASELEVIIEDTGRGFDFSRIGPTSNGGFGLFSIRERINLLGGAFDVQTAFGKGTRIRLTVLLNREPTVRPTDPGRSRVLLVDDHRTFREGVAGVLREQADFEVVGETGDGHGAIDLAMRLRPDVVLMDITMPRLSGIEATRQIHTLLPHVHVVGLSMHDDPSMADAMRAAGAAGYLSKDTPVQELIDLLRRLRSGEVEPAGA
jgi:PAS domain S-box-containing protein